MRYVLQDVPIFCLRNILGSLKNSFHNSPFIPAVRPKQTSKSATRSSAHRLAHAALPEYGPKILLEIINILMGNLVDLC